MSDAIPRVEEVQLQELVKLKTHDSIGCLKTPMQNVCGGVEPEWNATIHNSIEETLSVQL